MLAVTSIKNKKDCVNAVNFRHPSGSYWPANYYFKFEFVWNCFLR